MVVAVAGEVLILGTTATDMVPLGKITDPVVVTRLLADAGPSAVPPVFTQSDDLEEARRATK